MFNFKIISLFLIMLCLLSGYFFIKSLFNQLINYQVKLELAEKDLAAQNIQLDSLYKQIKTDQAAYLQLTSQIESSKHTLLTRTAKIEELKRENAILRIWANAYLPDDIICLHNRPNIKGSEYFRDLPEANCVRAPSAITPDESVTQ